MIDWAHVKQLEDDIGADAFPDLVPVFLSEVEGAMDGIRDGSALAEADMHALKGIALTLGFQDLAALAAQAELDCRQAPDFVPDAVTLLAAFDAEHSEFLARFGGD